MPYYPIHDGIMRRIIRLKLNRIKARMLSNRKIIFNGLDDGYCQYYVRDRTWCHQAIIDVEALVYDHESDAEQMLWACVEHDPASGIGQLRGFLAQDCLGHHFVHRMADHEVVQAVARELTDFPYQVVIEPGIGWAVQVDGITQGPVLPVAVEPEPELAPVFAELKQHLDALVAEQQKKFDQYEAELAKLSETEQAALYGKKAGTGVFGFVGDMVDMLKAFPGFYIGYLKTLRNIALAPSQLAAVTAESMATGSMGPLQAEIDKVVKPLAQGYDEAQRYKSMLRVLLTDAQTLEILNGFAHRYYAAANVAAKSTRLTKVAKLLEKLATMLKRVGHRHRLPKKHVAGADAVADARKASRKAGKVGMPVPEKPKVKVGEVVDDAAKKIYSGAKKTDGPKKIEELENLQKKASIKGISRDQLGEHLGSGGNKDVYAFEQDKAIGVLKPGKNPALIDEELVLLNKRDDAGLQTVNAKGPIDVDGRPALVYEKFTQGSKDVVRLERGRVRIVGKSPLLNQRSVEDLTAIRKQLVEKQIKVNDLQFLIGKDGHVVISDPLDVVTGAQPSKNNLKMIDMLIKSAQGN